MIITGVHVLLVMVDVGGRSGRWSLSPPLQCVSLLSQSLAVSLLPNGIP